MLSACSRAEAAPSAAFCRGCETTKYDSSLTECNELQLDYCNEAPECSRTGCTQQYMNEVTDYCMNTELCLLKAELRPKRSPNRNHYSSRINETERRSSAALIQFKRHCRNIVVFTVIFAYFVAAIGARPSAVSLAADVSEALGGPKSPERGIQEINPILRHRYSSKIQERLKTLHDALSTIKSRNRQLQLARANASGRDIPLEYDGSMDDELTASVKNGSYRNTRNCFFSPLQCQLPYARRMASHDENKENDDNINNSYNNNKNNNNNKNLIANTVITDGSDTVISYQTVVDSVESADSKLELRIGRIGGVSAETDSAERLTVLAPARNAATVIMKRHAAPARKTPYRPKRSKSKREVNALRQWQALLLADGSEGAPRPAAPIVFIETL